MDVSIAFWPFLTKIYPAIQLVLFCNLTGIVSRQLKAIRKRISSALTSDETQRSKLIVLRRHHRLICRTVRKLNRYFGVFLIIEVGYIFVISITSSLYILLDGILSIDGLLELLNVSVWNQCFHSPVSSGFFLRWHRSFCLWVRFFINFILQYFDNLNIKT